MSMYITIPSSGVNKINMKSLMLNKADLIIHTIHQYCEILIQFKMIVFYFNILDIYDFDDKATFSAIITQIRNISYYINVEFEKIHIL